MKILHITLGLPPWRSGGLTYYSLDLMKSQISEGNQVDLLYPGVIRAYNARIKYRRNFNSISVFELINPLPVSLIYGMKNPADFLRETDINTFRNFFGQQKYDIIHVHTIMGIYKELFEAAKDMDIKMVYTTHDYYGICLTTNLYDFGDCVCKEPCGCKCCVCSQKGLTTATIKTMQSYVYRLLKTSRILSSLKRTVKQKINQNTGGHFNMASTEEYERLIQYYKEIFSLIDFFHFNSTLTEKIFKCYIPCEGSVKSLTMSHISDNRLKNIPRRSDKPLRFGYIGYKSPYKGYPILEYCMDRIQNAEFHLFGSDFDLKTDLNEAKKNVFYHGSYKTGEIDKVFSQIDIIIIPSLWYETYGLVGFEALSYGVMPIVSSNVGFKDILKGIDRRLIFEPENAKLYSLLCYYINNREKYLETINQIKESDIDFKMVNHTKAILHLYNSLRS